MHPFFEPLDQREAMLVLTTLTVGGKTEVGIFGGLPEDARARVMAKAEALIAIPGTNRVKFMVKALREAWQSNGKRGAEKVDATWIIHALRGEHPRVVAAILVGLPSPLVASVVKRLPPAIRQALPPREEMEHVAPQLLAALRHMFESRFAPMPENVGNRLAFRDLVHLERQDLFVLMRDLGLLELAQAFVAVGKTALAELCRRLPREKAEELIETVKTASSIDLPDRKAAQRFLARVVVNFEDTEEFFQKAGLWRLAKGSLLENDAFRRAFAQRIPKTVADTYDEYIARAAEMQELTPDMLKRLQDAVLIRIRLLAKKGSIHQRWKQIDLQLHDPQAAEALIDQSAPSA